jgi:hypothetical protein
VDWWQLLVDGVLVPHVLHSFPTKFKGCALEGELQRWAFQQLDVLGRFAATATTPRRRPLASQQASYVEPRVVYLGPASGVVCVVEITAAFWGRYNNACFRLNKLVIKIGQGGKEL